MQSILQQKSTGGSNLSELKKVDRGAARITEEGLVEESFLRDGEQAPVVYEAKVPGLDPVAWVRNQGQRFVDTFERHRAILLRGFAVSSVDSFQSFVAATSQGAPLEYRDRSTPRTELGKGVYVSTIYPQDQEIRLHNEGTYWSKWALKIYFCCLKAAERGGATPLGDMRRVYQRIEPSLRQRFEEKGVLYVRNYGDGFGLPWQDVFQASDPAEVEAYCRDNAISWEWKSDGRLRTRQRRPAVRLHPHTGEKVWFNHAAFFHVSSLEPSLRQMLVADFAEEDLPYNTYFGDGSPITSDDAEALRTAALAEKFSFPWRNGDVLLLDNMCFAHGRDPYQGERQIVVAMTEPHVPEALTA